MKQLALVLALTLVSGGVAPVTGTGVSEDDQVASLITHGCSSPQSVAQAPAQSPVAPTSAPSTPATPGIPPVNSGAQELYATPRPSGSPVTPLPVPTATPLDNGSPSPIFLVRPSASPNASAPASVAPPSAQPSAAAPTAAPTLAPGYVAVLADKVDGSTMIGQPGDATGDVHIFYTDAVLIGDRAHYDGMHTITVTGDPYIVNRQENTTVHADTVRFDTQTQVATLSRSRGETTQGVETGKLYFNARNLTSTRGGVAHGDNAVVTTCVNSRGGYHLTGRTIDVVPGDKLTITKAVLFLGAAAVFYLPRVVIPLRNRDDLRRNPSFFPEFGYNSYDGFYTKIRYGFGKDEYYSGYYRLDYYSKAGVGIGYVGFFKRRDGKRETSVNYYGLRDRRSATQQQNIAVQDTENFSKTLRGNFAFNYNGNYGPFQNIPATSDLNGSLIHSGARATQTFQFSRYSFGSTSSTTSFGFLDQRQLTATLSQGLDLSFTKSHNNFGGVLSDSSTSHVNTLTHLVTPGADYQLSFEKANSASPFGINKLPELLVRPTGLFSHFFIPISAQLALGDYNEPQTNLTTSRLDVSALLGPALYRFLGSDFSASLNLKQDAYGTGDLKASITQQMGLTTAIGKHFVNTITYNENNNNGPAFEPFQTLDTLSTLNSKSAQDVFHVFNQDYYNLSLSTGTAFIGQAQPVYYQLSTRPSHRSIAILGGAFIPGSGQGFYSTNFQFATPFGRDAELQMIADIDWKNKGRIINKTIYYRRIIGQCYDVRVEYQQNLRQVNVTLNLLAFPSRSASFGINRQGPIIPTSFNF